MESSTKSRMSNNKIKFLMQYIKLHKVKNLSNIRVLSVKNTKIFNSVGIKFDILKIINISILSQIQIFIQVKISKFF